MATKNASGLTAQKLRMLLIVGIVALIIVGVGVFVLSQNVLGSYAKSVGEISGNAASSSENLKNLSTLKTTLDTNSLSVERTKALVAESKSYAYQDQIIKDLNAFAANSSVIVSGYTFDNGGAASGAAATAAPAPTSPAPTTTAPTLGGAAAPVASSLKTTTVAVSLKSPLKYESVMTFIHQIEQSLTKMQLTGISLSKDSASNNITASTLTIEVYVK